MEDNIKVSRINTLEEKRMPGKSREGIEETVNNGNSKCKVASADNDDIEEEDSSAKSPSYSRSLIDSKNITTETQFKKNLAK